MDHRSRAAGPPDPAAAGGLQPPEGREELAVGNPPSPGSRVRSRAMFTALVVVAGSILLLTTRPWESLNRGPAKPSPASASYSGVFRGSWASIDPVDGSHQSLTIRALGTSGRQSVFLHDTVATIACGGGPADVTGTDSSASTS